jgi:hypothetical protein
VQLTFGTVRERTQELPIRLQQPEPPHPARLWRKSEYDIARNMIFSADRKVALATDVATAVAEKLSAMQTTEFFASRKARVEFKAFDKLLRRRGGKRPRAGGELPAQTKNE